MSGLWPVFITGMMALLGTILRTGSVNWIRGNRMKNTMEVMGALQQIMPEYPNDAEMTKAMKRLQRILYKDVEVAERAALRQTEVLISAIILTGMGVVSVVPMIMLGLNGPNGEVRTTALIGGIALLLIFVGLAGSEWSKWYKSADLNSSDGTEVPEGEVTEQADTKGARKKSDK